MRWSDDGGKTFSTDRITLPSRTTAVDRNNDWAGKVKEFWNVDQMKLRNDTLYFMFTKIGRYLQVRGHLILINQGARSSKSAHLMASLFAPLQLCIGPTGGRLHHSQCQYDDRDGRQQGEDGCCFSPACFKGLASATRPSASS